MHAQSRDVIRCHQHRRVSVIIWWTCLSFVFILIRVSSLSLNHALRDSITSSPTSSSTTTSTTTHHYPESRLPIYVRNNGGEIFREVISANVQDNYVNIDFEETDGSHITELVDFRNVSLSFYLFECMCVCMLSITETVCSSVDILSMFVSKCVKYVLNDHLI